MHEDYLKITDSFHFDYPFRKTITKLNSDKKRTVYTYSKNETWVLKLLAHLLYKYDDAIAENCYSFRRNKTAKSAFDDIMKIKDLSEKHVLKLDIHDYFNSIDVEQLIVILRKTITDDDRLVDFMTSLLTQNKCYWNGELIEEKRGAMAGVPLASFFANIYLSSLDSIFLEKGIPYFRYSDDIILFLDDEDQLNKCFELIKEHLKEKKLTLNPDKISIIKPHESWEFLGFKYSDGQIDLSDATVEKMKGKIRRKAQRLYRNRKRKGLSFEKAATSLIRSLDYKFYDLSGNNAFTWSRFYFPVITASEGLHILDQYIVEYLRYLYSGRHYKGNYEITYEKLKSLGYTSLVNEYYTWKKENEKLNRQTKTCP